MMTSSKCYEIMGVTLCENQYVVITTARGAKVSGLFRQYNDRFESICVAVDEGKKIVCLKLRYIFMIEAVPEECKKCET